MMLLIHAAGYIVRQFSISIYDIAALVGVGGICIFAMSQYERLSQSYS